MGTWTTLLVTYLLGGVTFIPLLVLFILAHAHYTLPYRYDLVPTRDFDQDDIVQLGDETSALDEAKRASTSYDAKARTPRETDVAAGYFAVCREYTPMGLNAKPIERTTPVGSTTVVAPSPSVYQSMYRSIFDRRPVGGPLDNNNSSGNNSGASQRPKKAGNVFYVVLRHGHLMLFDDDDQLEVRHVISLAHHDVSVYSGGDVTPEGELFIKRNALCLSRKQLKSNCQPTEAQVSKPFFLFSENCSAKEDFYFALLKSQEQTFGFDTCPPIPKGFEVKNIISLVQRLHSSEEHVHSRWLNALLGRIFLAIYRTRDLENYIREKITKKIARVKRPAFLTNITIQKIDTGEAAPFFTHLKLKDLTVEGECMVEADVKYTGNFRIEVGATVKIDLGTRFKAREVTLLLAVVLRRLEGHVLFKVKAPPSNRLWLSFQTMPKMEMVIEPIVSSRQITYTLILRQIENRIKEVFAETLVQPFWDDVPFFKTEHKIWRGGIFQGDDAVETSEIPAVVDPEPATMDIAEKAKHDQDNLKHPRPIEKSHSLPVPEPQSPGMGLFGRKLGKANEIKAAPASSTGSDAKASVPRLSAPRSLSIVKNSTDPIVGTETAHADLFKPSSSPPDHASTLMASLASRSHDASPMHTPFGSPAKTPSMARMSRRSSIASKENDDRAKLATEDVAATVTNRRNTASSADSLHYSDGSAPGSPAQFRVEGIQGQTGASGRGFFARRGTASTTASESSAGGELKKTTFAAVTNAAEQARQWGWNAIRRQKDQQLKGEIDLSQPMGRGQPLPPPGTPLPGPSNGVSRLAPVPNAKRKSASSPTTIIEQSTLASPDGDHEGIAAQPPPPLPQRRRKMGGQQRVEDAGQNILIIAAPKDSQPGTPAAEEKASYDENWAGYSSSEVPGVLSTGSRPASDHLSDSILPSSQSSSGGSKEGLRNSLGSEETGSRESPLIAMPAAMTDAAEEEDFSCWLEDDGLPQGQQSRARHVATSRDIKAS